MFDDIALIGYFILAIIIIVGLVLGSFLASYSNGEYDDEYNSDSSYFDEKWKQNGPREKDE